MRIALAGRARAMLQTIDFHYLLATSQGIEDFTEHHELVLFTDAQYRARLRLPRGPECRARRVGADGPRPLPRQRRCDGRPGRRRMSGRCERSRCWWATFTLGVIACGGSESSRQSDAPTGLLVVKQGACRRLALHRGLEVLRQRGRPRTAARARSSSCLAEREADGDAEARARRLHDQELGSAPAPAIWPATSTRRRTSAAATVSIAAGRRDCT